MAIKKNTRPRVSVIIPTYNAGPSICQAVDSVLDQTFADYEIIVIDDGSTDDTRERLEPYSGRIRYIYQENRERSAARNNGIRCARGEYSAFLDADDYWLPDKLAKQVALLDTHPELGLVFAWAAAFDSRGRVLRTLGTDFPAEGAEGMDAFEMLALRTSPPTLTVVARLACIREAGMFDQQVCQGEDWGLWLRIALRHKIGFVPEILAYYRLSGDFRPAKLAVHRAQQTGPYSIRRVFALARTLPDRKSILDLENKALARAYWNAALIDYAVGNIPTARSSLEQAWRCDPTFFEGGCEELVYSLTDFALNLYDTWTPPQEARAFLEVFFFNLPSALHGLKRVRRATFRMVIAGHGFRAWMQDEPMMARRLLLRALVRYPELGRNLGIWSICLRSLLGERSGVRTRTVRLAPGR